MTTVARRAGPRAGAPSRVPFSLADSLRSPLVGIPPDAPRYFAPDYGFPPSSLAWK